jgi:hypothetical protein
MGENGEGGSGGGGGWQTNRARLGVFEGEASFEIGADGRPTDGSEESCRLLAPAIGTSADDELPPPPPPPPPPPAERERLPEPADRERLSWGLGLVRSAVKGMRCEQCWRWRQGQGAATFG